MKEEYTFDMRCYTCGKRLGIMLFDTPVTCDTEECHRYVKTIERRGESFCKLYCTECGNAIKGESNE